MGLPGRFAEWCDAVIARLASAAGEVPEINTWPSLDELTGSKPLGSALEYIALLLIAGGSTRLVFGARQPDRELRSVLAQTKTRFVVALDDPRAAVTEILAKTELPFDAVTRAVANSCPFVMPYVGLPGALALHADAAKAEPCEAIAAIGDHLGMPVDPGGARRIAADLAEAGILPAAAADQAALPLSVAQRKAIDGALTGYAEFFANGKLGPVIWTRDLFTVLEDPPRPPLDAIEIAGDSRCLIFGPYIHLPPGSWEVQVILGFSRETVGCPFLVDALGDGQLALTTLQPDRAGVFSVDLNFSINEPPSRGLEIRVLLGRGIASGQMAFGQVVLRPMTMRHLDTDGKSDSEFTSVLQF